MYENNNITVKLYNNNSSRGSESVSAFNYSSTQHGTTLSSYYTVLLVLLTAKSKSKADQEESVKTGLMSGRLKTRSPIGQICSHRRINVHG